MKKQLHFYQQNLELGNTILNQPRLEKTLFEYLSESAPDGLVFCGGEDINPIIYNEESNSYCHHYNNSVRDSVEYHAIKWAKENNVLFIADEVQTGFARTGDMFASDHEGIVPDLITMAKGMGGGLPVAAVTGRADVMDSIHPGGLGGTYGGNPIALAGALGAIETIEKDDLVKSAKHIESIMLPRLQNMARQHHLIGDVRGRGAMIAIEIVKPGTTEPDPDVTTKIVKACHAEGVLVLTAGTYGNVLRFLPPLVISDELLNEGLDVLEKAIASAS
jgi:4-aminobutyrate aminotransferase/(S)-3-amino-2-methylpropionate transaminase